MDEKDYKPGQRVNYSKEHGNWEVEVVENNCSDNEINYKLKVIREVSPLALGFGRMKIRGIIIYSRPTDAVYRGAGSIGGLVSEVES